MVASTFSSSRNSRASAARGVLAGLDLAARKFPLQWMPAAALTLADEDFSIAHHYRGDHFHHVVSVGLKS